MFLTCDSPFMQEVTPQEAFGAVQGLNMQLLQHCIKKCIYGSWGAVYDATALYGAGKMFLGAMRGGFVFAGHRVPFLPKC